MFERYTEQARRTVFFARYEASQVGSAIIEPEHMLLGLMREDENLSSRFLHPALLTIELVRAEIKARSPAEEKERISTSVELPLSSELKRVLAYAHEESLTLKHRHIGTEHLLLGLLREDSSIAAQVLREYGVNVNALREEILHNGVQEHPVKRERGPQHHITLGLEKLLEVRLDLLRGARVGLICNQASVDHRFRHAADLLHQHPQVRLTALFGPQHGIRGDVQDNMIETEHTVDRETGLPIHSLYSETREPTEGMLKDVDILVFDMQDVGCRIYTFAYTMANCMRAARKFGKKMIVCDRPNPITGSQVEGNVLEPELASFVGQFPIPTRHGMTLGEMARMFNQQFEIGCDLEVIPMDGWKRQYWYDDTDAPWVMPSPNIPTLDSTIVFPGAVHFEGTQVSEGRGTTRPFELIGAPYIEADKYASRLNGLEFPGVLFRGCIFRPTFQKHMGISCGGVQIHVTDREQFKPVIAGVAMVKTVYDMYRDDFRWKDPPYEYVYDRNPFDVISGTATLRQAFERGDSIETIEQSWKAGLLEFMNMRRAYLLY